MSLKIEKNVEKLKKEHFNHDVSLIMTLHKLKNHLKIAYLLNLIDL